ncbi:outer membrane beta-barrel protein [Hymenobacter jejuensis]|uniref:PorT family protein n=1 Tax=Hymenobacter jejuensis TaxID=2502781 RepID=A0A5B8A0W1_9BACT|nr:outer membrane beta-barrel protein [Hymenobacter jejuensis]QDA60908.1 PorT family protein [Hymenobacter jejuensis]
MAQLFLKPKFRFEWRLSQCVLVCVWGGNYSTQTSIPGRSSVLGAQAGVVFQAQFGKLALQPALVFSQRGYHEDNTYIVDNIDEPVYHARSVTTTRLNYLELPIHFVHTFSGPMGLQLFAGPYVAACVGGRQRYQNYAGSLTSPLSAQDGGRSRLLPRKKPPGGLQLLVPLPNAGLNGA